jgi:hypothetical protein
MRCVRGDYPAPHESTRKRHARAGSNLNKHAQLPIIKNEKGKFQPSCGGCTKGWWIERAYPATECFERVHRFFIARTVFAELARARCARRGCRQGVEGRVRVFAIALHVANFLVEFQVIRLQTSDLGP